MDIGPQTFFQILRGHSSDVFRGPSECLRLLTILNYNLTEEQLSSSHIDLYLLHTFDKSNGLFNFILSVASNSKFDPATIKSLEIIYTLINNFSNKIEQYILDINEKCLQIVRSNGSAKVKAKALDVLIISFEKVDKCLENQEKYREIFSGVENSLMLDHADSVKQKEFMVLGLFMKKFSYLIANPNSRKMYFVNQLEKEMVKGCSQGNINGIFTGFGYFCESFPLSLDNPQDLPIIEKLYKYIKDLSTPKSSVHMGNRAAIIFFGDNMKLFIKLAIKEFKQWHKKLFVDWLAMGVDDKKAGEQVLKAYLLAVSETLFEMNKNECLPILRHFIGWLKQLIKKQNPTQTEKKLAIQGLKYFCGPLYRHYPKEEAREVFLNVMQNFEKNYILNDNSESEEWEYLPDYIQCLASFMRYQSFTTSELYCLQRAVISMIKTFHKLKPLHHLIVIEALVTTFFYLKKTDHLDGFLENIIYQGVVWSCSHQHITDSELSSEHQIIITVKNYFPLWRGLLKVASNRSYDKYSIYLEDRKYILTKIVNELVKTLMIMINKLNVNVKLKDDVIQTDIETAYQVEQSSDYAIFLNVTDFYQEIFNNIDPLMFRHCICKMINHLVAKCLRYPLVSGFYKLLSFALKISRNLKLFAKGNITLNQDVTNCKETLSKFVTVLLYKMKQFKDELLISSLQVLLESPVVVVEPLLPECTDIFVNIFEVGRSYIALANMGLNTLELWQENMDKEEFEKFLEHVIPCLDSYLRSKSLGGMMQSNSAVEKKRKTAQALKKRTVLVELEPELVKFQKRILHFVGSQNSKICQAFVSPDNNFERKVTSDNLHLKVALPYDDLTLEVHLEPFVARVVELSLYCSDRKTRVMACELLQAFVMVFLGRAKQMPQSSLSDLDELLKSIAMPLLQLSCDIDQVVRQIFEPLMMQLIHWYSSKVNKMSPHLAVLITVLMEGVTHPTNSSLRDFSGNCLNEFVKWTIKQNSESELKNDPANIKVLVKRMRFFSGHPDLVKKLGAALIFNNIYKEIREERALISIFSMELLHIFIISLSLLETSNEDVENTVLQITNAVRHLKRVFVEKPQIFRVKDDLRRVPSDIPDGDLNGLSKWLLTMTASKSKYCRDMAMELFIYFQPLSGMNESLSGFVQHHFPDLLSLYEAKLLKAPTMEDVTISEGCSAILKWLQSFLCSLDGHIFIIKNSLCPVHIGYKNGFTVKALYYFLEKVHAVTIEQALKLVYKDTPIPYYTTVSKEQFSTLKASCCLAILKLASVIANDEILCENISDFWNDHLWKIILNVIFNPATLGLDDRAVQPKHLEVLELLLNTFPRKLNENKLGDLVQVLRRYVRDNFDLEIDLKRNVNQKQRNILKGLLIIQRSQINNLFKAEQFSIGLIDKLINNFYNNIDGQTVFIGRLSETTYEHCSLILKFALYSPEEYKSLLSHLYKNLTVTCQELSDIDSQSFFGMYFLSKFEDVVVKFIIDDFDLFLNGSEVELVIKLTSLVLDYLEKNKREFGNVFGKISDEILAKWFLFEAHFEENSIDSGLDFVRKLWKMFGRNLGYCDDIKKWVLSLIIREQIIMSEQEDTNLYLNIFTVLSEVVVNDELEDLSIALEKIQSKLEPVISSNPESNTLSDKLLINLPTVKNQTIFKFLIEFYLNNVRKVKSSMDLTYLLKLFMSNNTEDTHEKILETLYELSIEGNKTFEQKKILAENVLPHVFKNSNYLAFERFFEEHINQIQDDLKNVTDYGNGIVNFVLVEMLFLRIPIGSEGRTYCSITEAAGNPKLRASLLKLGLDAFKNRNNDGNNEHLRLYKCSAYKTLASIISNSIKSEQLYEKLFVRVENNDDILWNALIDSSVTYNFPVDFDSYPKKRKILVNIRDELREQAAYNKSKSFRYLASQKLFNSSLSEDVTKFDFTNTILRTNAPISKENVDDNNEEEEHEAETKLIQGELYLEATEINNHELMGTVCGIIDHIFKSGICQLPEDDEDLIEFPQWMEGIRNLLLNPDTPKNVKLFWVKVIDNMVHIFRHFARYFMEPLLQFLNDKIAGSTINYFVTDVVVILASWTAQIQPNEKEAQLASSLLQHLIENLVNERRDAFKYNLDLIKLFVENWKEFITVPYDSLLGKLNVPISDRRIEVGIHLTSIFLVNNILPCESSNITGFCKKLVSILESTVTSIYKPCAETIGLMLKYFKINGMEEISFSRDVGKVILGFCDINKYAGCLEGVAIHYPDIVDTFHLSKIFNRLPQSDQNLQTTFLKIMLKRVDVLNNVIDFKSEDWSRYLGSQNAEVQLLTLEIILKTFQHLKEEKSFKEILKSVCKNLLNPNVFCRGRMYDVLMAILDNGDIEDQDVTELCKEVLIQGLIDTDIEVREKIRKFWSENPLIPSRITAKFPYLMSNFYLAKAEEHFLGYTSYFLLGSIKSEEYEKELFEHPLEDCDFEEYKLQTNWRLQHPSVVPMFAETLRTFTEGDDYELTNEFGVIRATQNDHTFAPTQQTVREKHISQITSLETSLLGATVADQRSGNDGFINPNVVNISEKYKLPKRRFLKDKAKISANFAHYAVGQKIQKAVKRYEAVKEREKRVTIYRSYRKGDFPDIQITLGSLVKPLQMLVLHDSELSKTLFSVLYKTLSNKIKNSDHTFTDTILESIKRIFTSSAQYNVNVFSTLLDILLKSKDSIRLDPGLISNVCQQSGLISVGTLLIEEYLISLDDGPSTSKRGPGIGNAETRHWLKLAELYKELHEWNLVRTIFLEKSNCKEEVHRAITLESEKRWRDAQETYEKLLKTDLSAERQDFYFESYFKCLEHLGEWDELPKGVAIVVPDDKGGTWNSLWDNDWFQQKLLPCYISAQVKNSLFSGNNSQKFLIDINNSLGNAEQAEYLKNKFSEELCILWLTQKDTAQSTQYLKSSLDNFLNDWQLLNPMFGNLRYNKVLSLRNLIEIERFLECEVKLTEDSGEENLKLLEDYWKTTQKEFLPSIVLCEAKLLYRRLFIKLLLEKSVRINQPDLARGLKTTKIVLDIAFMNTAVEEENYYMTRRYFREYVDMKHPKLTMIYGNLAYLFSQLVKDPGVKLEKLFESLGKFRDVVETSKDDSGLSSLNKIFDISQKVTDVLVRYPDLYNKYESTLSEIFGSETMSSMSPMDSAFRHLKSEVLKTADVKENRNENFINEKTKALVKLAYFVQDKQDQEEDFVLFVLRAMQLGSKEARQLFPCILLLDSLADDLKDLFIRETESIPTWMFLGWIPQLLANVDSPKVSAISQIILRIAKTYPQAIMYSYRLSKENYSDTDNLSEGETNDLIEQLDQLLLSDPIVDKFLTALSKVNVPLVTLEYYLKKMCAASNTDAAIKIKNGLMEDLFGENSDSRDANNMQGNMYKSLKDLKNELLKINSELPITKIREKLQKLDVRRKLIIKSVTKDGKKFSLRLQDYCPWLANFSAGRMNLELEIPGQYSGEKLPLVQHHVKISGFCDTVSIMSSLRKPIKVTMLGMDSKEYPFLIKFGEDIRQDQRIQQLFILMNNIFASDNKSHRILTYEVIPLTTSLGIIQWVENTTSLDDFIKKTIKVQRSADVFDILYNKYDKFFEKSESPIDQYGRTAMKKDSNKVVPFYRSLVNGIPWDVLRQSVWSMSLTTECFIAFRNNFIKSYATICACQWVLGIGDRHLQNSKVCTKNGQVLGIDFGHAFGTGTQILPVPELVPIRLTPHLVGLMEPLKEKGSFRDVMIDCLKSLRKNRESLLATMNVFIQEPSVDWLEHARKFQMSDQEREQQEWYPLQKVAQARRKLEGASSTAIMIEDLKSSNLNRVKPQYVNAYISLVKGDPNSPRAKLTNKEILSVEEQVDSLIDHATDYNLLGRMYIGWSPYI